jgi:hypothetical protein
MRDFLCFLPLLFCISTMIYLLSFMLRVAAFVHSDPEMAESND